MNRFTLFATFLVYFATDAGAAMGQMACDTRADMLAQLAQDYSEAPAYAGLSNDGYLLEVLTSEATGTFTVLKSAADGSLTCLVDAGEGFAAVERTTAMGRAL